MAKRGRSAESGRFMPVADAKGSGSAVVEKVAKTVRCFHCSEGVRTDWTYCPYCGTRQRVAAEKG